MFEYMHLCIGVVDLALLMHTIGCIWQYVQGSNGFVMHDVMVCVVDMVMH